MTTPLLVAVLEGDRCPQPVKGSAHPRRIEQPRALLPTTATATATATATDTDTDTDTDTAAAAVGGSGTSVAASPSSWKTAARRPLGASLRLLGQTAREHML